MKAQAIVCVLFALALGSARTGQAFADDEDAAQKDQPKQSDKVESPTTDIFSESALMGAQFATGFNPRLFALADDEYAAQKDKPKQPDKEKKQPDKEKKAVEAPQTDIFSGASLMGPQFATGFNPNMMGDNIGGGFVRQFITVVGSQTTTNTTVLRESITGLIKVLPTGTVINSVNHGLTTGQQVTISGPYIVSFGGIQRINGTWTITVINANQFSLNGSKTGFNLGTYAAAGTITAITGTTTTTVPVAQARTIVAFDFAASGLKVAENESPLPQDRVFFTYNFFGNIQAPANPPSNGSSTAQTAAVGPRTTLQTVTTTSFPNTPPVTADLHREIFGFEKTFLDGLASIEVRLPLLQQHSDLDAFSSGDIGDLTIIGKYALLLDRDSGNVFTVGMAVTAPTGPSIATIDGTLHSTYLQPWFGYIWNADRFYLQAFHSIVVPTDPRDVTMAFNDVGLNYWLYRASGDRPLRYIVPMIEAHVTTPLNHRDPNVPVYLPDIVDLTAGVHLGLFSNATLSFGVATPVTGPHLFGIEAFTQLNWRF
jgi:hypothetical protein